MVWAPEKHFDRHLPFTLLTGFLGSGKTTFLNWLLRQPGLGDTAVMVNEFGAVPLDHVFIEAATEDIVVLPNGCMCCFAATDLEESLANLFRRCEANNLPRFKRLIIETSGLADPEQVLLSLLGSPIARRFLWLDRIIATVDAEHGLDQLAHHREASKQARLADRLVITKSDLVEAAKLDALQEELGLINGAAPQLLRQDPGLNLDAIFSPLFMAPDDGPSLLGAWVMKHSSDGLRIGSLQGDGHEAHHHDRRHGRHSTVLTADRPIDWREFHLWLGAEQRRLDTALLRVKGIVNVGTAAEPVVVHAVQSTLHVPVSLAQWPDADRSTRIVFILAEDRVAEVELSWAAFLARMRPPLEAVGQA